jgi:hypothetical protein
MATEALVREFQTLADALEKDAGPLALLMLLPVEPNVEDAWTVLVSARSFDGKSTRESLNEISAHLNKTLSSTVKSAIKQAAVLKSDGPFVTAMNAAFHSSGSSIDIYSTVVAGVEIPRAIVFESKRIAA